MNIVQPLTLDSLLSELAAHPVNSNRFFVDFQDHHLTTTQLHTFIRQYHFFCHHFTKELEGLLYHTPIEELEMRVELTKTLYSELGSGSPNDAHIRDLEHFAKVVGLNQDDLNLTHPIAEVQEYLATLHHLFVEAGYLQALGAELAVETTAASEFRFFVPGLQKYSQFTDQDLKFFTMHLAEEEIHRNWLTLAVLHTVKSTNDLEQVALGARTTADAWHTFWDGMHQAVFHSCKLN